MSTRTYDLFILSNGKLIAIFTRSTLFVISNINSYIDYSKSIRILIPNDFTPHLSYSEHTISVVILFTITVVQLEPHAQIDK